MAPPLTRPATRADLPACAHITVDALSDLARRQGRDPPAQTPDALMPLLEHAFRLAPHGMHVAEAAGSEVVAFASAWPRDDAWWLGFLFARPSHQRSGLGAALLARAMAPGETAANAFTFASSEASAMALYLRHDMLPRATILSFTIERAIEGPPPDSHRLEPLRRSSLAFERERFGYARGHDHRYLLERGARGFEIVRADGERAGFGYASPEGLVGPVAVATAEDVAPALALLARETPAPFIVRVPHANDAALQWAVAVGARLTGTNLVMARAPLPPWDLVVPAQPGIA